MRRTLYVTPRCLGMVGLLCFQRGQVEVGLADVVDRPQFRPNEQVGVADVLAVDQDVPADGFAVHGHAEAPTDPDFVSVDPRPISFRAALEAVLHRRSLWGP